MVKRWKQFLLQHELLIFILCLVAILRLPSLLEPYWYGDEGIYLTLGQGVRKGMTLYKDIHDNKPPGIYFLAALSGSLFWFRLLLLGWNLATIAVFNRIASKILQIKAAGTFKIVNIDFPKPNLVTFSTLIFALLPFAAEGNIANGEIFMLLPVLLGFDLLLRIKDSEKQINKFRLALFAGLSFSFAFLIKVPSLFDAVSAGIIFFLLPQSNLNIKDRIITIAKSFLSPLPWIFGLAFATPIIATIAYYYAAGAGEPYLRAALLQNVGYLSSWQTGTHQANLEQTGLMGRAIAVGLVTLISLVVPLRLETKVYLGVIWLAYALFGALLSERPYPHYLIQIIPPVSLLIPMALDSIRSLKKKFKENFLKIFIIGISLGIVVYSIVVLKFWSYPIFKYFRNYTNFVTKQISKDDYLMFFDKTLPEQYSLATYITNRTTPADRIFIWGDLPSIYALTRRSPPGRFTATYHVKDFNGFDETHAAILKNMPKFILIDKRIDPFTQLYGLLSEEYVSVYTSDIFELYRRVDVIKNME